MALQLTMNDYEETRDMRPRTGLKETKSKTVPKLDNDKRKEAPKQHLRGHGDRRSDRKEARINSGPRKDGVGAGGWGPIDDLEDDYDPQGDWIYEKMSTSGFNEVPADWPSSGASAARPSYTPGLEPKLWDQRAFPTLGTPYKSVQERKNINAWSESVALDLDIGKFVLC